MAMTGAAAAAATGAATGVGLFSYNRGNYMFDQKNHYTRFTAGLNMAIAQTGIYKQDIAQLTELTVTRQDCYHGIAAMGLTVLTAIYCPGRVGLHEPPPPGWLMGLEFVNIAGCYLFLGLALWFAMHASMRADTAATHLLTRFVRLPIPSQGMLDKARKFLSSYEEQPLKEVLRVPFTRHGSGKRGQRGYNEDYDIDDGAKGRSRHGLDVPAWYRKEKAVDNCNTSETIESMMPLSAKSDAPEHFEAYREIQMEWFPYDVYARLSIFLAFMHLIHCWTYLQICYLFQEVRAVWACAIVVLPMFVLQQVILTLDIRPSGFPIHRVGPFAMWFAFVAAAIEYMRWYDAGVQAFGFFLVYVAYGLHIVYTLALYRLCAPSEDPPQVAESPGASWWPGEWRLPSAFQHAIWLVAPPKQLKEGEVDIVGELRDAQTGPSKALPGQVEEEKRRDVHRALGKQGESSPWFGVKVGLISLVIAWIWLTFGFTIEIMNQGTAHPSLLSAPGMPNNARDPRYRPTKPGLHEPTEVGTGGVAHGPAVGVHMDKAHRRLLSLGSSFVTSDLERQAIAGKLREVLPILQDVARGGAIATAALAAASSAAAAPEAQTVQWPPLFEPELLACAGHRAATMALSRHGRGTVMQPGGAAAQAFALHGVAAHGPLLAAGWGEAGLHLATAAGTLLHCPGDVPSDGKWRCQPLPGTKLPLGTGFSGSIAITGDSISSRAAVRFPGEETVTLFSRDHASEAQWLPIGEARAPAGAVAAAFTATEDALVLRSLDGAISHMRMDDGGIFEVAPANRGYEGHAWKSTCPCSQGGHARLAVPTAPGLAGAKFFIA